MIQSLGRHPLLNHRPHLLEDLVGWLPSYLSNSLCYHRDNSQGRIQKWTENQGQLPLLLCPCLLWVPQIIFLWHHLSAPSSTNKYLTVNTPALQASKTVNTQPKPSENPEGRGGYKNRKQGTKILEHQGKPRNQHINI